MVVGFGFLLSLIDKNREVFSMARFDRGYILLHRTIDKSWIGKDPVSLALWVKLLVWANYKEGSKVKFKGEIVRLKPGQVLTTTKQLAEEFSVGRATVENRIKLMIKDGSILQQNSNKGRLITICNWEKYQVSKKQEQQQNDNKTETNEQQNRNRTETEQQQPDINLTLSEEGEKETRKEDKGSKKSDPTPPDLDLASRWLAFAKDGQPHVKSFSVEKFAADIGKARRSIGYTDDEMVKIFEFIEKDEFWKNQAYSPGGLLKRSKNDLRKIDNIIVQMNKNKPLKSVEELYADELDVK